MTFEVGKKYQNKGAGAPFDKRIHTCVYMNDKVAVLEWEHNESEISTWPHNKFESNNWQEHKEPIKTIEYVYRHKKDNKLVVLGHSYVSDSYEFITTVEFKYDIHNGLKVEVIKGIG
jgi:hypothetical protein